VDLLPGRYPALQLCGGKFTSDEVRRIGKAIARILEFLLRRQGFYPTLKTLRAAAGVFSRSRIGLDRPNPQS
jgi:hypothetical protein